MASGKSQTADNLVLQWLLSTATANRPTTFKIAFSTTNPTNTSAGTGLAANGTYAAGGSAVTFGTASGGQITGHSAELSWTPSGTNWTIEGAVLHQATSGHPAAADVLYWTDAFGASASITVNDGVALVIAANGITVTET